MRRAGLPGPLPSRSSLVGDGGGRARPAARDVRRFGRRSRSPISTAPSRSTRRCWRFEKVGEVELAGEAWERLEGVFGLRMRSATHAPGVGADRARRVPRPGGPSGPGRLALERPLVPARRDHRLRHGEGLRAPARAPRAARLERPAAASGLEPERRRDRGVLLQGPRRPRPRDPCVSAGEGRTALAGEGAALSRNRSHGDRRVRHGEEPRALPRRAGDEGRRRRRKLRHRAGAPQQRLRRAPADHGAAGGARAGHRVPGVPRPSDGRPRPSDVRSNDLVAWQTELRVRDAAAAEKALFAARAGFLSPGLVTLPSPVLGFSRALLAAARKDSLCR